MSGRKGSIAIIWSSFGLYHLGRLKGAARAFERLNLRVVGIEVSRSDRLYPWKVESADDGYERVTLFERDYWDLEPRVIRRRLRAVLDGISPVAVAVDGWAFPEAKFALRWAKRMRRPVIVMSESKEDDMPRSTLKEYLKRLIVRRFDGALVGGGPQMRYVQGLGIRRERIFPGYDVVDNEYFRKEVSSIRRNPGELRRLRALPENFFLAAMRPIPEKNLPRLLEAYQEYRGGLDRAPWGLVICGSKEQDEEVRKFKGSLEGVDFRGFTEPEEMPLFYALANCFILPSIKDSWGLAVNEAMASGLPVLVSRKCGCAGDLVKEGFNGFTFDPFDVREMAEKMRFITSCDGEALRRMGKNSESIISPWSVDLFGENLLRAVTSAKNWSGS